MKIIVFSDYLDHEDDIEHIKLVLYFHDVKNYILQDTTNVEALLSMITPNSIIFIDYGALSYGQSGMVDHINRYLRNIIENNVSSRFYFILTMGKEYYSDDLFEFDNVFTIDRCASLEEYKDIFYD